MTSQLATWAMQLWRGDRPLAERIASLGEDAAIIDSQLTMTGPSGVRGGLILGADPITNVVMLGFWFAGPRWASIMPNLCEMTAKAWREARLEATANA